MGTEHYFRGALVFEKFEHFAIPLGKDPANLRVSHLATDTYDGTTVPEDQVKSPFLVIVKPTDALKEQFSSVKLTDDLYESTFSKIPKGTTLYNVYAKADPESEAEKIGSVKTKSEFHHTLFGDTELRFYHELRDWNELELLKENSSEWIGSIPNELLKRIGCPFLKMKASILKNKDLLSETTTATK